MWRRTALACISACALAALVSPTALADQAAGSTKPEQLWRAYPLEQTATNGGATSARPPVPRASTGAASSTTERPAPGSGPPWAVVLVAVAAGLAGLALVFRRMPAFTKAAAPTRVGGHPGAATASRDRRPSMGPSRRTHALASAQPAAGESVIGYLTVDRDPSREREALREIHAVCEQAGWRLEEIVREGDNGRMVGRPGLTLALERIAAGDARGLVVSDARSLVGSLADFSALVEWLRDAEAALIAVELAPDPRDIADHPTARTLDALAGWEAERTATRAHGRLAPVHRSDDTARSMPDDRRDPPSDNNSPAASTRGAP